VNQAVHVSFQSDKSFCGLAALYRLALTLLSRALQGIPYSLFEMQEGASAASLRVDIAEFASEVCRRLPPLLPSALTPVDLFAPRGAPRLGFRSEHRCVRALPLPPRPLSPPSSSNDESNLVANGYEQLSVKVPAEWVEIAGGPQAFESMLQSALACYLRLRSTNLFSADETAPALLVSPTSASLTARVIKDYLFSFRQLLLALVSIASSNSAAFPSEAQKTSFVSAVLDSLMPVLRDNLSASSRSYAPKGYPSIPTDYFLELRHQELEHLVFILIRLFGASLPPSLCSSPTGNFHLEVLGKSASFESFMVALSEITSHFANDLIVTLNSPNKVPPSSPLSLTRDSSGASSSSRSWTVGKAIL
jgi:hypothetical protein